jgi:glucose/mannose transport system substrate-binding protein
MTAVTLRHRWSGPSELQALQVVADALAQASLRWADAPEAGGIEMVKMHGQEIVAAAAAEPGLLDMAPVVDMAALKRRLWPCALESMLTAEGACHGLPMGIHRSNCLWFNAPADEAAPADLEAWRQWLERQHLRAPHPLAASAEPWQLGLLFECVLLACCGVAFHRAVFVDANREAIGSARMGEALEAFASLRRYVSERSLGSGWRALAADLREGRVAAFVMGDWARKEFSAWGGEGSDGVRESAVPGTQGLFVFNVDYFVPVRRPGDAPSHDALARLAGCLMSAPLQQAFNRVKGSRPAVRDADAPPLTDAMVPSMSFDHACDARRRALFAESVAAFFLGDATREQTVARLLAEA